MSRYITIYIMNTTQQATLVLSVDTNPYCIDMMIPAQQRLQSGNHELS